MRDLRNSWVVRDAACAGLEGADRIVVVVKTGATEANLKVPPQLRTSLRCAPNIFIFSDMEQTIGKHKVHDALKNVRDEIKDGSPDFHIYREQQKLKDPDKIIETLSGMRTPDSADLAAWTLDKYKNIHIAEDIWELQPNYDWYLYIDADTYVMWPTLLQWTKRLDPDKISYMGAKATLDDRLFAHGGTGYLLSRAAMFKIVVENNGTAARWDPRANEECCGDLLLALAIKEYGIDLINVSPTMNGYEPDTIPFDKNRWCQYVATMHHITPDKFENIAQFEADRADKTKPIRYADIFDYYFAKNMPTDRDHWDNWSQGEEGLIDAHSKEECKEACKQNPRCTQTKWDGEQCIVEVDRITMGMARGDEDGKSWYSTWDPDRIKKWVSEQGTCALSFPGEV
ncbi:hypothetical protein NA57DRAFT_64278 [Rhizodiscina lignyota]|uniref:Glycosyltransferase family 31 protein n=1 Tax=Rhizodiscina lignyota TaxID=1504668 RepID=A0A9P4INS7_9PEZI|nr:hypothetical protein NA57DRAFT_64278 [Rhizodiscina lignyota]